MKCPHCKKKIDSVKFRMPAKSDEHETLRCVAYACEECESILSVESDPRVRDSRLLKIESELQTMRMAVEMIERKQRLAAQARSAGSN